MAHNRDGSLRQAAACLRFAWKQTVRQQPQVVWASLATVPFSVLDRLADLLLLSLLVEATMRGSEPMLLGAVLAFALYRLLSGVILRYAERQLAARGYRLRMAFLCGFAVKYMQADFAVIESTQGKDQAQRARQAMAGSDYREKSAVETVFPQCAALLGNLCGLFVYTGIISVLNPLILVLLVITAGVDYLLQRALVRYDQKDKSRYIPLDRRLWYLVRELRNLGSAKDIRLYGMMGWLRGLFEGNLSARMKLHARRSRFQYLFLVLINGINTAFTAWVYWYLIRRCLSGGIGLSQFLLYFGLITGFNGWLMSLIDGVEGLHRTLLTLNDLRVFHALPDGGNPDAQSDIAPPVTSQETKEPATAGIRLEDVSFGYADGKPVIAGMNLQIRPGEKLAIVGRNGAGKTTLVKLLCGLYTPQAGRVLLDGQDLRTMDPAERLRRFAVVFQDIHLLPTTIERNLALSDQPDADRLAWALKLSGLEQKVQSLPQKQQTILVRSVWEDAIDLSGGEVQKLALARALYKGGEVFLLDEPTAALDPLAEHEMYQKYDALTQGKTAIFISHRLSSTRFCDRILYLEDGSIRECGTHDELMQLGGAYFHMFETQSRYYRKQTEAWI